MLPSTLNINEDNTIIEWISGKQIVSPRPALPHAKTTSGLMMALATFDVRFQGSGGWQFYFEPELHFGKKPNLDVVVPDLAGWRVGHLTKEMELAATVSLAPDFVCEVLSPSTARIDYTQKLPLYARERVAHVWLIDPLIHQLEVFRLEKTGYVLVSTYKQKGIEEIEPFGKIRLDIVWP